MKTTTTLHRFTTAALLLTLGTSSSLSLAQTSNEQVEEIVITGKFLRSLQSAMEQKRNATSMIEAIAAEDIGQLPDVSISDSLNRLPGLAQDRDRGNGSQISIRGMGGLLGLTTLNGREVATVEEDRNVRYDQFPSELINAAQVYKTPQAHLPEGGLSGTVNLETIKPLEFDSRRMSVDVRGSFYDLGGDIDDAANDGWGPDSAFLTSTSFSVTPSVLRWVMQAAPSPSPPSVPSCGTTAIPGTTPNGMMRSALT